MDFRAGASGRVPRPGIRRRWAWPIGLVGSIAACGGAHIYPLRPPVFVDGDMRPFDEKPEEYFSPLAWDGADQTVFRPIARFLAVDPSAEAVNVNALDEVPDSSWFTNRIGSPGVSPERLARGPCETPPLDPRATWIVKEAKPNGANPGFVIEGPDQKRYLIKFDGLMQAPRATAADVLGTRLYWAAGYHTPCNRIVYFDRQVLSIDPQATAQDSHGNEKPLTEEHLDQVFSKALRLRDGRYRASSSLYLAGEPLGPWTYQGLRCDDPNDVIPHEDRRELRAMRLIAAWIQHFDSREQNTMSMWIETGQGRGYVRHHVLDFGDSLGSLWAPPTLGRRIGHAYYFDVPYLLEDWVTFGAIERPWDRAEFGASGRVFAYFAVRDFDPEAWRPGYPNPAFGRMQERDGAWMARLIAQLGGEHLRAVIRTADLRDRFLERELYRILMGRRQRILRRYLLTLSPLTRPEIVERAGTADLCLSDLAVSSGTVAAARRSYASRSWAMGAPRPVAQRVRFAPNQARACTELPEVTGASRGSPGYLIVDLWATTRGAEPQPPSRVHLYHLGGADYRIVGLERPEDHDEP